MGQPTILVIEDDDHQRLLYEEDLKWMGYNVVAVKNGHDGLQALQNETVHVVLLDIAMPGMDGIEALGKILDHDNQLPVILNTAYSSYKDDFMTWAAEAYVIKSHDLSELHQAIAAVLEKRGIAVPEPPAEEDS
ncbi:MAG: response regulator [Armatimonadetes bacterium]|nr:response regulator [Armatimonadota bacterium]